MSFGHATRTRLRALPVRSPALRDEGRHFGVQAQRRKKEVLCCLSLTWGTRIRSWEFTTGRFWLIIGGFGQKRERRLMNGESCFGLCSNSISSISEISKG